jgi:hypothetical protein
MKALRICRFALSARGAGLRKAACPSGDPQRQSCGFSSVEAIMQAVERKASRRHMSAKNVAVTGAAYDLSA